MTGEDGGFGACQVVLRQLGDRGRQAQWRIVKNFGDRLAESLPTPGSVRCARIDGIELDQLGRMPVHAVPGANS